MAGLMVPICPLCNRVIPPDDFNVSKDLVFCRACNESYSFADLIREAELEASVNVQRPPVGTWYKTEASETVVGGSSRSIPIALGALAIALFWNGIVSLFICCAISGTLHLMGVAAPPWLIEPKMNGHLMKSGEVVFLWLFLTPFILIGAGFIFTVFMKLAGKVEVRVGRDRGTIFSGIGPIGRNRKFDPRQVAAVKIAETYRQGRRGGTMQRNIEISFRGDQRPVKFGDMLCGDRQNFVAGALSRLLNGRSSALTESR